MAEEEKRKGEISRREFLKDAGLVVGGVAIGSAVVLAACAPKDGGATATVTTTATTTATKTVETTKTVGAGATVTATVTSPPVTKVATVTTTVTGVPVVGAPENVVKLTVNGEVHYVEVEPQWTLQFVLHDRLDVISVKDWCDQGGCGSCTVNMDGRPVLACMMLAIECGGKKIETAEGIAAANHPLIDAYVLNHCMQCGYCTPGFIVTAKVLLDRKPNPTEDEIKNFLSGNLCRCTTYPAHLIAIPQAAKKLVGGT